MTATTFTVMRSYDPELIEHNTHEDMARYAVSRDESILKIPEHARPMRFHCRVLSRDQRRRVQDSRSLNERRELAFRYGVLEIENAIKGSQKINIAANRGKPDEALSDDALDSMGVGDLDIAEIGEAIITRSFLAAGITPRYPLLLSSELAYETACFHLAAQKAEQLTPKGE